MNPFIIEVIQYNLYSKKLDTKKSYNIPNKGETGSKFRTFTNWTQLRSEALR